MRVDVVDGALIQVPAWLDLTAIVIGALLGGALAVRHAMAVTGVLVLAVTTGLGGGLIRDVLLQQGTPIALTNRWYLITAFTAAGIAFFFARAIDRFTEPLIILDALALGFFTLVGAERAQLVGLPDVGIMFVGVAAATAGSVIKDLMLGEVPEMLRPGVINAMASIVGAISFVVMLELDVPQTLREILTIAIVAGLRWLALWRNWHAPIPVDVVAMVRRKRPLTGANSADPEGRESDRPMTDDPPAA
jgi:uncharacterized membrane protein YeiH